MEHMNIHKFQKYNKLLFSPWSVVTPARYVRVELQRKWKNCLRSQLNFLSLSNHSWKATSPSSISRGVWLSHQTPCLWGTPASAPSKHDCLKPAAFPLWSLSPFSLREVAALFLWEQLHSAECILISLLFQHPGLTAWLKSRGVFPLHLPDAECHFPHVALAFLWKLRSAGGLGAAASSLGQRLCSSEHLGWFWWCICNK